MCYNKYRLPAVTYYLELNRVSLEVHKVKTEEIQIMGTGADTGAMMGSLEGIGYS